MTSKYGPFLQRVSVLEITMLCTMSLNFYIGRVVEVNGQFVEFKFLHRVGAYLFDWPRRDDIDSCHVFSMVQFNSMEMAHSKFPSNLT